MSRTVTPNSSRQTITFLKPISLIFSPLVFKTVALRSYETLQVCSYTKLTFLLQATERVATVHSTREVTVAVLYIAGPPSALCANTRLPPLPGLLQTFTLLEKIFDSAYHNDFN